MHKSLVAVLADGLRLGRVRADTTILTGSTRDPTFWNRLGSSSFTGTAVSVDSALKLATVWACVRLISETLATLPLGFYQRNADGSRTPATTHGLYEILHNQPNGTQTAVVFWEVIVASMLLWGNAFVEIIKSGQTVIALQFLYPARVTIRRLSGGGYEYRYRDEVMSQERVIPESRMMHVPAFSTDGIVGLSPIAYGANVFSTSIETDKASAETFKGSMRATGLLTMDMTLAKQQREDLRAHIRSVSDSGGVIVIEKGTSFEKLGFDPVSAELLASRSWNVEEMCRWYRVDPSMIGHGSKDSNWGTGLEQKMLWFITFTLRPWCVKIEQAVRKNLLTPVERMKYFAEFAIEGLLRGDSAARASFYSTMTQNGIMTRDECRQKENLEPMGGNAEELTVQSNMLPIDKLGENLPKPDNGERRRESDQQLESLRSELAVMRIEAMNRQQPPINVDARTTVSPPPPATVNVTIPEYRPAPVNVDARTTVLPGPPAEVTVNVPEAQAPNVHVDGPQIHVEAPPAANVTVTPPQITVNVPKRGGQIKFEEDKDGNLVSATVVDG